MRTKPFPVLRAAALCLALLALAGCEGKSGNADPAKSAKSDKSELRRTLITVTQAEARPVVIAERTEGWIETPAMALIAAETAGRITRLHVDTGDQAREGQLLAEIDDTDYRLAVQNTEAEIKRLESLTDNQQRVTERHEGLIRDGLVTQAMLDDARAQLRALQEQLNAARTRRDSAQYSLARTRVHAPVGGQIEKRLVATGSYVKAGDPLLQLASNAALRVHLPFPETLAARLRPGLTVELSTPLQPGQKITARITSLRPLVESSARSIEAIVEINNPGNWKAGASVDAAVILEKRATAFMVPELSVVARPKGTVVYLIDNGIAKQQFVEIGLRQGGFVEIRSGLQPGATIALDGAGFLTDGAAVRMKESGK